MTESEKLRQECSKFYRIGYKTAYRDVLDFLKHKSEDTSDYGVREYIFSLIDEAKKYYEKFPCIDESGDI